MHTSAPRSRFLLHLIPEYSGINKGQRIPDRSKTAHRKPPVKCFLTDEMAGWHHRLSGREFEQAPGDSEGQESQACCSPYGCRFGHNLATQQQHQLT